MPREFPFEDQPVGAVEPVCCVMDETTYMVAETMKLFHTYENKSGEPIVFLREVADYLNVSVGTVLKGFRAKELVYCDYQIAKAPATDLWSYLYSCYNPVGEISCKGEVYFVSDVPNIHVSTLKSAYIASLLDSLEETTFMDQKMMTATEAAQLLGISTKALYRLLKSGQMPYFKIGSMYRISIECLALYHGVKNSSVKPSTPNLDESK